LGTWKVDNFASIVPKIIAFTRLCNLKILLDFQVSLRFLLLPDDPDIAHASLEFDNRHQNQINQLKSTD